MGSGSCYTHDNEQRGRRTHEGMPAVPSAGCHNVLLTCGKGQLHEPADEAPLLSLLPLFSTPNKNLEARAPDFTLPYRLPYPPPLRPSRPPHLPTTHVNDHELSDGFLDEIVDSSAARDTSSLRLDTLVAQGRIH